MKLNKREYEARKAELTKTLTSIQSVLELAEKTEGKSLGSAIETWNDLYDMVYFLEEDLKKLEINQIEFVSVNR